MTGTVTKPSPRRLLTRSLTLAGATAAFLGGSALVAGPASAAVPQGWPDVPEIDPGFVLGVLVGGPILLFAVITLLVYAPGLVRGERVAPGATGPEDQWLGGRRSAGELPASTPVSTPLTSQDEQGEQAETTDGGASVRW